MKRIKCIMCSFAIITALDWFLIADMKQSVPQSQNKVSHKARDGTGNAKQQKTQAAKTTSKMVRPQTVPSAATTEAPPPYQPPSYSPHVTNFAYQQMLPNAGYQMLPLAMQQAVGQPLQITLQIQQPLFNPGAPNMFQPPPFSSVQCQSVSSSAAVVQPQSDRSTSQQSAFKNSSSSAKVRDKVDRKSPPDVFSQAVNATAKGGVSSVHCNEDFRARGGRGQRGSRQHRGRGQQFARGRGGFTGENVLSMPNKPAGRDGRASGSQGNEPVHSLFAGREQHHAVQNFHDRRGQWNVRRRGSGRHPGTVPAENPPLIKGSVNINEKCPVGSLPSHYLHRGHATQNPPERRNIQSRGCMVPVVGSTNSSLENSYNRSCHQLHRGRGGQGWTRQRYGKRGSMQNCDISRSQTLYGVERRSVSEVASDAGDWEDVETVSMADSESVAENTALEDFKQHSVSAAVFTSSAQAVFQHSYRGRGKRERGRFRGRWISDTSRCAYRVPQVINNKVEETCMGDAASVTEQSEVSSITDNSEWVDENMSESSEIERPHNQKIKRYTTGTRGRGRVVALASRRLTGRQKTSIGRAVLKNSESFETATLDCFTDGVASCSVEVDNAFDQRQQQHFVPPNSKQPLNHVTSQQNSAPESMKTNDLPQKLTRKQRQQQKQQQVDGEHGKEQESKTPLESCEKLQDVGERAQVQQQGKKTRKLNKQHERSQTLQPNQLQQPDEASSVASSSAKDAGQNVSKKKNSEPQKQIVPKDVAAAGELLGQQSCGMSTVSSDVLNIPETDDNNTKCGNTAVVDAQIEKEVAVAPAKVDENTVIGFILNNFGAQCQIEHLYSLFGIDQYASIKQTVLSYRRIKVFERASDVNHSEVFIFLKGLRLCASISRCRKGLDCPYLHMCPNFVTGGCLGPSCPQQHSHSFIDEHNLQVIKKHGIYAVCKDESVLLKLAQCSNPVVCLAHNETEGPCCAIPESCLKLHVCNEFLRGRCLIPNAACPYGHNLYDERTVKLLQLIELIHLRTKDERLLRKMILTNGNDSVIQAKRDNDRGGSDCGDGAAVPPKPADKGETKHEFSTQQPGINFVGDFGSAVGEFHENVGAESFFAEEEKVVDAFSKSLTLEPSLAEAELRETCCRCDQFEKHKCGDYSECFERHGSGPYFWRLQSGEDWIPFDRQHEIEQAYCNPDIAVFCGSVEVCQHQAAMLMLFLPVPFEHVKGICCAFWHLFLSNAKC
jgi:hypothetical protein